MIRYLLAGLSILVLAACAHKNTHSDGTYDTAKAEAKDAAAHALEVDTLYEVHKDGRFYIFSDHELYRDFVKTGHTAYMKNFIGAGPGGETLVFGLTGAEKKMMSGWKHVDLFNGDRAPQEHFYGELFIEGRIHVFSSYEDMVAVRKVGEAPYRFTQIGAGPDGETVVFVLNSSNKKKRPDALIELFKKMNM